MAPDATGEPEPRVGRKALFFLILGAVFGVFLPLIGLVVIAFLALAWIVLVLVWVLTGAQTRRPLLYILAFTVGFILVVLVLGWAGLSVMRMLGR
jgi:hypothetical protein